MLSVARVRPRGLGVREAAVRSFDSCSGRSDDACDERFVRLLRDCRPHGGLAREEEIETRRACLGRADRRDARSIVCVRWSGRLWVPVFQFEPSTLSIRAACAIVVAELAGVYDEWRLAEWFVHPNEWLGQTCPAEHLDDTEALRAAARADRFVAIG